jgi:IS5 family transposase
VAIPLAAMSSQRVTYLYELMDAAYDAQEIHEHVQGMGHVPIIDPKACRKTPSTHIPLGKATRQMSWAQQDRYRERTMVERVYARLKDEFGCRQIRVRGPEKVMAHLMFGVLALTVDQLLKIVR